MLDAAQAVFGCKSLLEDKEDPKFLDEYRSECASACRSDGSPDGVGHPSLLCVIENAELLVDIKALGERVFYGTLGLDEVFMKLFITK